MNSVILLGNLTKDPEQFQTDKGKNGCRFGLAVNGYGDHTDFFNCCAFEKTAEFISKYFNKGSRICVRGSVQTGSYEKDGVKHYTTTIFIQEVDFAQKKTDASNDSSQLPVWTLQ